MNKNKIFSLIIVGLSFLLTAGCTSKKEQLTVSTLTIAIDPQSISALSAGNKVPLTAICKSAKSDNVDIAPTWSVDPANMGTFNPVTGKTTVFTAGSVNNTGKIYASYADVRSAGVNVTVGSGGPFTGSSFVIYADGFSAELAAPGAFQNYGSITLAVNSSDKSEGTQSFSATYTTNNNTIAYAGWYVSMPASTVKDMSAYAGGHLRFDIKTAQDIQIGIRSDNVNSGVNTAKKLLSEVSVTPDGSRFQSVAIPISQLVGTSGTDLTQMKDMFIAAAVGPAVGVQTSQTFLIDNIRWTVD